MLIRAQLTYWTFHIICSLVPVDTVDGKAHEELQGDGKRLREMRKRFQETGTGEKFLGHLGTGKTFPGGYGRTRLPPRNLSSFSKI